MVIASASVASSTRMKIAPAMAKPRWLRRVVDMNLLQQTHRLTLALKRDPCGEQAVALGDTAGVRKTRRYSGCDCRACDVDCEGHLAAGAGQRAGGEARRLRRLSGIAGNAPERGGARVAPVGHR